MRKRIILMTAVFLAIVCTTNAQNRSHEKRSHEKRTHKERVNRLDSIAIKYGLDETQKANFKMAVVRTTAIFKSKSMDLHWFYTFLKI